MSKIESGKLEIVKAPFVVSEMLQDVIDVVDVKCIEKNIKLEVDAQVDFSREMIGDSLRLSQILTNLMSNATKFTPEGGKITLRIIGESPEKKNGEGKKETWLNVDVIDTGIGISKENQAVLFNAFEQADGSITRNYGGSGLGLSICKNIVELMDGEIWVRSQEGKGSTFSFRIPIEWGEAVKVCCEGKDQRIKKKSGIGKNGETISDDIGSEINWAGKTILLAEDIEINREIVIGMLEETNAFVECAEDGQEAVDLFVKNPGKYDLIIMDMQMPRMDGLAATREIRASGTRDAEVVPIVAMTANAFKEDVARCLEAGMNEHLAKPLDIDLLVDTISKYL